MNLRHASNPGSILHIRMRQRPHSRFLSKSESLGDLSSVVCDQLVCEEDCGVVMLVVDVKVKDKVSELVE